MAPHSFFSEYLARYTRERGNPLSAFRGSVALDGADGLPLAPAAGRVRQGELGLSPLGLRVRLRRLAASDGLPTGRSGSIRRAVGQPGRDGWARACARGGRAPKQRRARPRPQPGRLPHPAQIHILTDRRGRPLRLRVTGGQRRDSAQARALAAAGTDAPRPCLIADRSQDGDAFRAWLAQQGLKAVLPARHGRTHPQRPGTVPGAPRRGTEPRMAPTRATRGHPL